MNRLDLIAGVLDELRRDLTRVASMDIDTEDRRGLREAVESATEAGEALARVREGLMHPSRRREQEPPPPAQSAAGGAAGPVRQAWASTDCPECGGFVPLSGSGRPGELIRLTGYCPNKQLVYYNFRIPLSAGSGPVRSGSGLVTLDRKVDPEQ